MKETDIVKPWFNERNWEHFVKGEQPVTIVRRIFILLVMLWIIVIIIFSNGGKKVKQSRYTPWRRLGGEEV
jgi:hypothetical protein